MTKVRIYVQGTKREKGEETNQSLAYLQTQLVLESRQGLFRLRSSDPSPADNLLQLPHLLPDHLSIERLRVHRLGLPLPCRLPLGCSLHRLHLGRQNAERNAPLTLRSTFVG